MSRDIGEQVRLLLDINPGLRINCSTNGTLLDSDDKREAALLMNHLTFSIHGASQESLRRYQRGGDFARAYHNMKSMVEYKNSRNSPNPTITWTYVLFNWNDAEPLIVRAVDLAKEAKVDSLLFVRAVTPFYGISWRSFLGRPFNKMPSCKVSRWYERFSVDLSSCSDEIR
jgi:MoaA/NifB/PqqE/SkfB family radical SAM enzyme